MKLKLPITDKTLLEIYEFVEDVNSELNTAPRSFLESASPDYKWLRKKYEREYRKKHFYHFVNYLKKKGYIKIKNLEGKKGILLTPKGKNKALKARLKFIEEKNFKLKKRKDGKWLMITFDIPENKRKWRDFLRERLQGFGFVLFQKSIWVSPYDVKGEIEKFVQENQLDEYVRLFLIEEIEIS
ncbi:MAG TPA: hypothetical protein PLY02_02715 [Candidatus Pacearchaeota archaeon]|nr:hypothetical protein [Candidatus Pacearchaeota archaeon]HOK94419.1 hypothetical protein [Candidatus Pacearchaeota archaeon]